MAKKVPCPTCGKRVTEDQVTSKPTAHTRRFSRTLCPGS